MLPTSKTHRLSWDFSCMKTTLHTYKRHPRVLTRSDSRRSNSRARSCILFLETRENVDRAIDTGKEAEENDKTGQFVAHHLTLIEEKVITPEKTCLLGLLCPCHTHCEVAESCTIHPQCPISTHLAATSSKLVEARLRLAHPLQIECDIVKKKISSSAFE